MKGRPGFRRLNRGITSLVSNSYTRNHKFGFEYIRLLHFTNSCRYVEGASEEPTETPVPEQFVTTRGADGKWTTVPMGHSAG